MNRYIYIIIGILIIDLFIYFFIVKDIAKKDLRERITKILYQSSKAMIIFLVSLQIYSRFDLLDFFSLISEKDIGISIAVYTFLLSLLVSLIEIIVNSNSATIDIFLSSKKTMDHIVTENIKVTGEKFVTAHMFITIEGNFQKFNNSKIKIQFPKTVTAQIDTSVTDKFNMLTINISEYVAKEGRTRIPIDLLKQKSRIDNESYIKAELIKGNPFYKNLFIRVTSNRIGVISE